jgi:hypothetical protein
MMPRISLCLSLIALLTMSGSGRAETRILMGAYGQADIARICVAVGGTFTSTLGVSYGCKKENCDGEGGTCEVTCTDPLKCKAETPARIVGPTTLIGILQNGDSVFRGESSVDSGPSSSDGDTQSAEPPPILF